MRFFFICLISCLINTNLFASHLTIGTLDYDPPFETASDNKNHFFGFDIDIMNEICNRLHQKCHYKAFTFEQLLSKTKSGQLDLAIAGISITPERQLRYLFSLPYKISKAELLIQSDSAIKNINDINKTSGIKIGIEAGTVFKGLALKEFPGAKIIEFDTQNDLFQAITDGSIDVSILDAASAKYWVINNPTLFKELGNPILIGMGYGIMANLSSSSLINSINKVLIAMENDGSYLAIYKRYF